MLELGTLVIYSLALAVPAVYLTYRHCLRLPAPQAPLATSTSQKPLKSIMQSAREDLLPPKNDPFTTEQLTKYDGSNPDLPIYVAIKGTVFDVTHKADVYGQERSYNVFAGKDGSKGLGMSSLKPEDAVADYSSLNEHDMGVLDQWHAFFQKRYNVVGRVIDGPLPAPDIAVEPLTSQSSGSNL